MNQKVKLSVLVVIMLTIFLMATMAFASGKVLNIGGKNYVFVPRSEVPAGAHILWVKSIQEFKATLKRITAITEQKSIKPEYKKESVNNTITGMGFLYDQDTAYDVFGLITCQLTLNGRYYFNNGKITSIQANLLPATDMPTWEFVSSSKSISPTGLNYCWASGTATFRCFIGIEPIGVTVQTITLSVFDMGYVPN